MEMIWHHDPFVSAAARGGLHLLAPYFGDKSPEGIQFQTFYSDRAKETCAMM